jgi:hypothetical protein
VTIEPPIDVEHHYDHLELAATFTPRSASSLGIASS